MRAIVSGWPPTAERHDHLDDAVGIGRLCQCTAGGDAQAASAANAIRCKARFSMTHSHASHEQTRRLRIFRQAVRRHAVAIAAALIVSLRTRTGGTAGDHRLPRPRQRAGAALGLQGRTCWPRAARTGAAASRSPTTRSARRSTPPRSIPRATSTRCTSTAPTCSSSRRGRSSSCIRRSRPSSCTGSPRSATTSSTGRRRCFPASSSASRACRRSPASRSSARCPSSSAA